MQYVYELITSDKGLPVKTFIHSVDKTSMHLHREIEIILILEGSIELRIENKPYLLEEDDVMIVNSNEIHSSSKTGENNVLLSLQIDPIYYSRYYNHLKETKFCCESFENKGDKEQSFNIIIKYLAQILLANHKKTKGYKLIIGSEVNMLLYYLLNNFNCSLIDSEEIINIKNDMKRIESIIEYIDQNYNKKITLQEVAENEYLSVYHTSHFIKSILGISFQEYLNSKRLGKFIELLMSTDKTITEISYESGFPSAKSLNRLFKLEYNCSPSEYKRIHKYKDDNFKNDNYLDVNKEKSYKQLENYLEELNKKIEVFNKNNL